MVPTLIMGGVILAFSQLIAYSWLKIPADIGIMDALNSGKFTGFDLSLLKFAWLSQSFGGVLFTKWGDDIVHRQHDKNGGKNR